MRCVSGLLVVALAGSVASATELVDFSFANAAGVFVADTSGGGTFSIDAVSASPFETLMSVSAVIPPLGDADFDAGFVAGGSSADLSISLNVAPSGTDATGTITITDADGDTLTADITGTFDFGTPGAVFFNAALADGNLNDVSAGNSDFNGSSSGSFPLSALSDNDVDGAFSMLFPRSGTADIFGSSFSDTPVLGNGFLVPAPGSAALLALGGLAAVRRRR